jgi:amino acid transporter
MADRDDDNETRPLLKGSSSSTSIVSKSDTIASQPLISSQSDEETLSVHSIPDRTLEDDVLPETSTLGRTLNWQSAFIIVISRVIGSGIFATPGAIFRAVGSPGLSLLLWVVGSVVAACGLSVALEYGSMLPRSGGQKVYLEFTYRRPRFLASTLVAVNTVLLGFTASNCVVFAQYALFAFGKEEASDLTRKGLAVGLLTMLTIIHGVFPKTGVRIQNWLGWVKVGVVLLMVLSGLYVVAFRPSTGPDAPRPIPSWDGLWAGSNWNWGIVSTALFKVSYSYAGLENITNVLNEVKDPVRTLRSVTSTALLTSCVLYLLINVAYFLVVPLDELKNSGEMIGALFFQRVFGARVGRMVLPLAIALSAAGNVMVVMFALVCPQSPGKKK